MTELLLLLVAMVTIAALGAASAWATSVVLDGRRPGQG